MDFSVYKNKIIKADISNGYYYSGLVLSVDSEFLTIEDLKGMLVTLSIKDIKNIREIKNGF